MSQVGSKDMSENIEWIEVNWSNNENAPDFRDMVEWE